VIGGSNLEEGDAVIPMWIYTVVGPVAALIIALVLYALERGPIVGSRWLRFLSELEAFRARKKMPLVAEGDQRDRGQAPVRNQALAASGSSGSPKSSSRRGASRQRSSSW
jgi:hypothetical protein